MTTVHIRLYAGLQDMIGARDIDMVLPAGATVARLREQLGEQYPVVQGFLPVKNFKDAFKKLWDYKRPGPAGTYFTKWVQYTMVSGVEALRAFGRRLLKAKDEILNFCKHHITIGPLEGFNNTISRIIHRACGVTNLDYLFLKLRQESLEPDLPK